MPTVTCVGLCENIRTIVGELTSMVWSCVDEDDELDRARKRNKLKESDSNLGGEKYSGGVLTAIVSVKVPNPEFEGQTKTKLGNTEVRGIVETIVAETLTEFLEFRPAIADAILEKAIKPLMRLRQLVVPAN